MSLVLSPVLSLALSLVLSLVPWQPSAPPPTLLRPAEQPRSRLLKRRASLFRARGSAFCPELAAAAESAVVRRSWTRHARTAAPLSLFQQLR